MFCIVENEVYQYKQKAEGLEKLLDYEKGRKTKVEVKVEIKKDDV